MLEAPLRLPQAPDKAQEETTWQKILPTLPLITTTRIALAARPRSSSAGTQPASLAIARTISTDATAAENAPITATSRTSTIERYKASQPINHAQKPTVNIARIHACARY